MPLFRKTILIIFTAGVLISSLVIAQPYDPNESFNSTIQFNKVSTGSDTLNYAFSGDPVKPGILFIHGTPGVWSAFGRYLSYKELQNDFFMVSVDRLGWGNSTLDKKQIDGDFIRQANTIAQVFKQYPNKKWIVVGHSLGASIAPKVALAAPESVAALLLLAGSLKPSLGNPRWYNYAASTWFVGWFLSDYMKNSNKEIMALRKQLKLMDKEIKNTHLSTHLVIMQGMKDKLVSPKNPDYVASDWQQHFSSTEIIKLPESGHFLPWNQTPLVITTIRGLANKAEL